MTENDVTNDVWAFYKFIMKHSVDMKKKEVNRIEICFVIMILGRVFTFDLLQIELSHTIRRQCCRCCLRKHDFSCVCVCVESLWTRLIDAETLGEMWTTDNRAGQTKCECNHRGNAGQTGKAWPEVTHTVARTNWQRSRQDNVSRYGETCGDNAVRLGNYWWKQMVVVVTSKDGSRKWCAN